MKKRVVKKHKIGIVGATVLILSVFFMFSCDKQERIEKTPFSNELRAKIQAAGLVAYVNPFELPLFEVRALDGSICTNTNFEKKVTVLNFWAPWCPPCRQEMPSIEKLHAKFREETQFQIVAVAVNEKRDVVFEFISKENYSFPVYVDEKGALSRVFASRGLPTTYIVDKSNNIIAETIGVYDFNVPELELLIKELLK